MNRLKLFLPLLVFIVLALTFFSVLNNDDYDPQALPSALLGQPVPAFQLQNLQQQAVNNSHLPKQNYLLNVWATWCPTCHQEHSFFNELAAQGILIIGVNYKDERQAALQWLDNKGNPYGFNIFDPEGLLGLDLGVYGAPETFVVNTDGIIVYKHVGAVDQTVWQQKLAGFFPQLKKTPGQTGVTQ